MKIVAIAMLLFLAGCASWGGPKPVKPLQCGAECQAWIRGR